MNKIKFSHKYEKMPEAFEGTYLMQIFVDDIEKFSSRFIDYDARIKGTYDHYPLPQKGKVIVLLLITGRNGHVWTTVRRWTPQKEEYYRSKIGEEFEVHVE